MEQKFSMKAFMKKLKSNDLILALGMPMGYQPGMPVLHSKKDAVCITIPFFRRRISRKQVKETGTQFLVTETYPVRYSVTYALRAVNIPELDSSKPSSIVLAPNKSFLEKHITEGKVIAFSDLSYRSDYTRTVNGESIPIAVDKPICIFKVDKKEYEAQLEEIYDIYDKAINTRLYANKIDGAVENRLINKINALLAHEIQLKPFYRLLDDGNFAEKLAYVESNAER